MYQQKEWKKWVKDIKIYNILWNKVFSLKIKEKKKKKLEISTKKINFASRQKKRIPIYKAA